METNLPVIAKRAWSIIRVALFMLKKGITKGKLMMELNSIMLKRRGKIAGKALTNLMFHHHHHHHHGDSRLQFSAPREYEFSCSNTPNFPFSVGSGSGSSNNNNKRNRHNSFFTCAHAPATLDDDAGTVNAVKAVLEMLNNEAVVEASPALPGFGKSPVVRKLIRVTDSPFPLRDAEDDKDNQVDKDADEFIKRFYKNLRNQA